MARFIIQANIHNKRMCTPFFVIAHIIKSKEC